MVIYEVNLTVPKDFYPDFQSWLNNHIKKMLLFNGFIKHKQYLIHSNNKNDMSLSIHYYVKSMKHLNDYFSKSAKQMREEGIKKFGNNLVVTRRILEI